MLKSQLISSDIQGPKLLILGAIHGNEKCGTKAIRKVIRNIKSGEINIIKGAVNFVPICNPKAYKLNKRYFQENLNRVIKKEGDQKTYESKISNLIIGYIENADYILDLHSIKTNGVPFIFQDYDEYNYEIFCKNIGLENIVKGWPRIYEDNDNSDTIGYAHKIGKIGAVVECGKHEDVNSEIIAYNSILNTMITLGIIDGKTNKNNIYNFVDVLKFINKTKEGRFVKSWDHMDKIYKGEKIAIYKDGEIVYSDIDGLILLPNKSAGIGEEWFYIGK